MKHNLSQQEYSHKLVSRFLKIYFKTKFMHMGLVNYSEVSPEKGELSLLGC